ncbi:MAG: cytochrome c [bacterium]|nr:cytochrome c [bacterium]
MIFIFLFLFSSEELKLGKKLYEMHCLSCHGKEGKGDGPAGKVLKPPASDFTDNVWKHGDKEEDIAKVIKNGIRNTGMAGFPYLKDNEIKALIAYIRTFSKAQAQKQVETKIYSCPMHKDIKSDKPGKCPKCKMTLK